MTWSIYYDDSADETTVRWERDGYESESVTLTGKRSEQINGKPSDDDVKDEIGELIQSAGTPKRIRMLWDATYPFGWDGFDES